MSIFLNSQHPKHNGRTIQGHHTYSVSKYPHLAGKSAIIYPATFNEHLHGWHGGNFKKGLNSILKCHKELSNLGITTQLFEHDRPCELQFLKNLSNTYQEISDEIDAEEDDE